MDVNHCETTCKAFRCGWAPNELGPCGSKSRSHRRTWPDMRSCAQVSELTWRAKKPNQPLRRRTLPESLWLDFAQPEVGGSGVSEIVFGSVAPPCVSYAGIESRVRFGHCLGHEPPVAGGNSGVSRRPDSARTTAGIRHDREPVSQSHADRVPGVLGQIVRYRTRTATAITETGSHGLRQRARHCCDVSDRSRSRDLTTVVPTEGSGRAPRRRFRFIVRRVTGRSANPSRGPGRLSTESVRPSSF